MESFVLLLLTPLLFYCYILPETTGIEGSFRAKEMSTRAELSYVCISDLMIL